jgi:hypothetical protein
MSIYLGFKNQESTALMIEGISKKFIEPYYRKAVY